MKIRIGCLGLLALWAVGGAYLHLSDRFGEDGGGRFAMIGLLGLAVVIVGSIVESLTTRRSRESRGFPVKLDRPDDEA